MSGLSIAVASYNEIGRRLKMEDPDIDEQTLADTIEGLTDLHEIVAAIMRSALIDEALVEGLRRRVSEMKARLERIEDRASKRRQIARDVMVDLGIKKITAPDFTLSIRPGTPSLVVVDEEAIPEAFFEPQKPKLNRQALLNNLRRGDPIAGVALGNPQPVLSVRTA